MANQSKVTNSPGKKCGKKLSCKHACQAEAGTEHTCACANKWTLDPGCGHSVTGNCTQSPSESLSQECLAECGQILHCGHPCKQKCANACACLQCDRKNASDLVNLHVEEQNTMETPTSSASAKASESPAPAAASSVGPNTASEIVITDKVPVPAPASSAETPIRKPVKKFPLPQPQIPINNIGINCTPVLKLSTPKSNASQMLGSGSFGRNCPLPTPNSRGFSPQPSTSRAAACQDQDDDSLELFGFPKPESVDQLPAHQLEQLKKFLPASVFDKNATTAYHQLYMFTQCVNEHLFPMYEEYCPVCGCPPHGPNVTLYKAGTSAKSVIQTDAFGTILDDDNAWKLGFAKCSQGHYFHASFPRCDACGEASMFFMGNEDGDSD